MSSSKDEDLCIAERDFNKTKEMHIKLGFKEGSFIGHTDTAQHGFDTGFKNGILDSVEWGRLLGKAKAIKCCCSEEHYQTIDDIISEIETEKEKKMKLDRNVAVDDIITLSDVLKLTEIHQNMKMIYEKLSTIK